VFYVLSLFFPVTIALLAGALSSAEERQLGTFDSQAVLPIAASTQWLVKVGVALGLALIVGIGLPWAFMTLVPSHTTPPPAALVEGWFIAAMTGVLVASLYVSSLTTSGIRAAVVTVPTVLGFVTFFTYVDMWVRLVRTHAPSVVPFAMLRAIPYLSYMLVAGFFAMLLSFAFANHRSADRTIERVAVQVLSIAVYVLAVATVTVVFGAMRPPYFIR
jgi:hypothetical protein